MTDHDPPLLLPVDTEGDDDDHDVPVDLTVLHEVIEWDAAQSTGPNEPTP